MHWILQSSRCSCLFQRKSTLQVVLLVLATTTKGRSMSSSPSSLLWTENREQATARCIFPLSSSSYKGSSGRIGVLGGSARYTGAPYYAAMAALKVGADLSFVFCAEEAAVPIKSYSPELMVAPVYSAKEFDQLAGMEEKKSEQPIQKMVKDVTEMMDKIHCLVIGPGLGRCPIVQKATARIIQEAQARKIPLVLDADALYMLTLEPYTNLLKTTSCVVLTPNAMERKRFEDLEDNNFRDFIVVEKGQFDVVTYGDGGTLTCGEVGGLKRSGGLGDILAGSLGTLTAWNSILTKQGVATSDDLPLASWTACCIVKKATKQAFGIHRRSMTAPDVLTCLGPTVDEMTMSN